MSDSKTTETTHAEQVPDKGKGKVVEPVESEEDDSSDEEMGDESHGAVYELEDAEEDDLAEIDTSNIIQGGRRTRGRKIDFAAVEKDAMIDDDEEDDEEYKAPETGDDDPMEH